MDYIAVYEDEEADDGTMVKVSLYKIQRTGVRPSRSPLLRSPEASVRSVRRSRRIAAYRRDDALDGFIESFSWKDGSACQRGRAVLRVDSPRIQQVETDFIVAMRAEGRNTGRDADEALSGAIRRLENLRCPG